MVAIVAHTNLHTLPEGVFVLLTPFISLKYQINVFLCSIYKKVIF